MPPNRTFIFEGHPTLPLLAYQAEALAERCQGVRDQFYCTFTFRLPKAALLEVSVLNCGGIYNVMYRLSGEDWNLVQQVESGLEASRAVFRCIESHPIQFLSETRSEHLRDLETPDGGVLIKLTNGPSRWEHLEVD